METKRRGTWSSGVTLKWSLVKLTDNMKYRQMFLLVLLHKNLQPIYFQGFFGGQIPNIPKSEITLPNKAVFHIFKGDFYPSDRGRVQPQLSTLPSSLVIHDPFSPKVSPCVASESLGRFSKSWVCLFWDDASPKNSRIVFGHSFTDVSQLLMVSIYIYILIYNHQKWFGVGSKHLLQSKHGEEISMWSLLMSLFDLQGSDKVIPKSSLSAMWTQCVKVIPLSSLLGFPPSKRRPIFALDIRQIKWNAILLALLPMRSSFPY